MLLAIPLLVVLGIALPLLGWFGQRQTQGERDDKAAAPGIRVVVIQIGVLQLFVGGLAVIAIYGTSIEVIWQVVGEPLAMA